jgi:hypothetical protein
MEESKLPIIDENEVLLEEKQTNTCCNSYSNCTTTAKKRCPWPNNFLLTSYASRTFLEVMVGKSWSLQVIVLLRRQDIPWFHSDMAYHEKQILQLIQDHIIEKEFPDLIQLFTNTAAQDTNDTTTAATTKTIAAECNTNGSATTNANRGKSNKVIVGATNLRRLNQKKIQALTSNTNSNSTRGRKKNKMQQQGKAIIPATNNNNNNSSSTSNSISNNETNKRVAEYYKPDVAILFGETLQITYRMEEVPNGCLTLLYNSTTATATTDDVDGEKKKKQKTAMGGSFRALKTLPRRLVLWCYPLDQNSPTKPNPEDSGFPRPEMIPLISLFQPPRHNTGIGED